MRCGRETRHQLLIDPDIAYTSHNGSRCFTAQIRDEQLAVLREWCQEALAWESAAASDPGLCVAPVDLLARPDELIAFGRDAKQRVLTKGGGVPGRGEAGRSPL